jgi:DHA1 family multidrug resistance protein-like MFS transporter
MPQVIPPMLRLLHDTYVMVFRRYPVLGRMAVVAVLGELVFASINNYALSFYVLEDLRQPGATLGLLASTFLVVEMVLKMPFGHLSDRYGRRLFASAGLSALVVTPVVICLLPTDLLLASPALIFTVLMPLRALDGVGAAALWPPLFAGVPDNVPSERRGVAMSVLNTSYLAGLALGPTLGGMAMRLAGALQAPDSTVSKAPFALAAVAALGAALVARGLPESRSRENGQRARHPQMDPSASRPSTGLRVNRADTDGYGSAAFGGTAAAKRRGLGRVSPTIATIMMISFCEMFAVGTLGPYMAPYIRHVTGIARSDVGLLLLVLFIPAGVLGIPVGHLVDRWPRHRVVQAAFWTAAVGMGLVPLCGSLVTLLSVGVVVTMGFLFALPAWLALVADLAPEGRSGRVIGTMATAQGAGAFVGPLLGGHLWDIDIRYPWLAAAALLALAGIAAVCCIRGGEGRGSGEVEVCRG